jgi:subtilisin family serine protease
VRRRPLWLALAACLSLAPRASAAPDAPFVPDRLIVVFQDAAPRSTRQAVHDAVGAVEVRPLVHPRMDLAIFDAGADLDALSRAYLAQAGVEFAQPDWIGEGGGTVVPNSTWYPEQWHHRNIGQSGGTAGADLESEEGWVLSTGSAATVVAVLDSGIDSDHPEFAGRLLAGWDYMNNDSDPEDDHGHGTAVTALLAANADNAFGVAGVDWQCKILPVKVLDQFNAGSTTALINGLGFATTQAADVISMSLINYPCFGALGTALNDARSAGAILVACAGNGGIGDADLSCPGASTHTISIGATDHDDWRAWYSGTGAALEFVAPGDNVVTAAFDTPDDTYWVFNGCSSATPVAAGIVSILRGLAAGTGAQLRTPRMRTILRAAAEDLVGNPAEDTAGRDDYMGWGRLNLRLALEEFFEVTAAPAIAAAGGLRLEASPNPSAGETSLRFGLPAAAWVRATLYDASGRAVRTLLDGPRAKGPQEIRWDGTGGDGRAAAAGVYFVRLEAAGTSLLQKITRLR